MSKIEELASREWSDLGFCNNEQSNAFKLGYLKGYYQAEKDLELTWKDIEKITDIWDNLHEDESVYIKTGYDTLEFYKEVLKQFTNYKEKKEK